MSSDPSELLSGTEIGPYQLLELAGSGAMGVVWKARDRRLNDFVALKFFSANCPEKLRRGSSLKDEAKVLLGLTHPVILRVRTLEEIDGLVFIVMEYLEGPDLARLLEQRGKPLDPDDVRWIISTAAGALDFAHARGILHRDMKPANLILTSPPTGRNLRENNELRLADFGLARALTSTFADRPFVAPCGTPAYMAPEVLSGRPPLPASDIYGLAASCFHLATGRWPFSSAEIMPRNRPMDPPDPKTGDPDLDAALCQALALDPLERPITAGEFAALACGVDVSNRRSNARSFGVELGLRLIIHSRSELGDNRAAKTRLGVFNGSEDFLLGDLSLCPTGNVSERFWFRRLELPPGETCWRSSPFPLLDSHNSLRGTVRLLAWKVKEPSRVEAWKIRVGTISTSDSEGKTVFPFSRGIRYKGLIRPSSPNDLISGDRLRIDIKEGEKLISRYHLWFRGNIRVGRSNHQSYDDNAFLTLRWLPSAPDPTNPNLKRNLRISRSCFQVLGEQDKVILESMTDALWVDGRPMKKGATTALGWSDNTRVDLGDHSKPLSILLRPVLSAKTDPWRDLGTEVDVSCSFLGIVPPSRIDGVRIERMNNADLVQYALVFRAATIGGDPDDLCRLPDLPESALRIARIGGILYLGVDPDYAENEGPDLRGYLRPITEGMILDLGNKTWTFLREDGLGSLDETDVFPHSMQTTE